MHAMKPWQPLLASLILFGVSLFLPALYSSGTSLAGIWLGLFGYFQVMDLQCFAWLANPVYAFACLFYLVRSYRLSLWAACLAMLIGLDTFRATGVPLNEGGTEYPIDHVGAAFYVWELGFLVLALGARHFDQRRAGRRPPSLPSST